MSGINTKEHSRTKVYSNNNSERKYKNIPKFFFLILGLFLVLNTSYAQGPNAPEAASFEPVDATDMVNLVTGDLSYVLPLLNIPSPEGGYPIALSYHAGIAMEQEASWVGLGWNLNPGTINRGVNGYPDDWGKTNVNEFFYDKEFEEDIYSFSAGLHFSNAISVGLGASWGSNQSFGGYVEASIGIKGTGANVSANIGNKGANIGVGINGFSATVGTNGVGLGYGYKGTGVGLNYSPNSGLSGGFSVGGFGGQGIANRASIGVSFDFKSGASHLTGTGVTNVTNSTTAGPHDVRVSSTGLQIPIYMFYIGYRHTKIKYSLFNYKKLFTSGMLYPVAANEVSSTASTEPKSVFLKENNFMDVNVISMYNDKKDVSHLVEESDQITENNLVLPNYDNYTISAQGLSGSLSPYFYSELNLSGRGKEKQEGSAVLINKYAKYINNDYEDYNEPSTSNPNSDATKKINFTMKGAYSSFLRTETSTLSTIPTPVIDIDEKSVLDYVTTLPTTRFANSNSLSNGRKKEGNYIETYTNKEIRENSIFGFVEANNIDRSETKTFLDEGIGAYQVTTLDGRTYHYSLPVYNFETFYKNFKNDSENIVNENQNFLEIRKTTPYATHWLLTGITGPDYVDKNENGKLDKDDYGYWVEFDYGKWTDGYIWETPNGYHSENEDEEGNITYSYSWGRKQIYYLDVIKTRTHTALFVKDIRNDNKSSINPRKYDEKWVSGIFDPTRYSKKVTSPKKLYWTWNWEGGIFEFYDKNGQSYSLPLSASDIGSNCSGTLTAIAGKATLFNYVDVPQNQTLRLSKIILLKNSDANFNKSTGSITDVLNGAIYFNRGQTKTSGNVNSDDNCGIPDFFYNRPDFKQFESQQHHNVLDIKDIEGLNLESKAQQIIELNHDYSLAKNSPNSNASQGGRLSLKQLNYKGKQGIQTVPPYKFSYLGDYATFDDNNIDDWGYRKNGQDQVWSLNEIQTPTGGKIKIAYEDDSYYTEAASYEEEFLVVNSFVLDDVNNTLDISFDNTISVSDYYEIGREVVVSYKYAAGVTSRIARLRVSNISNNKLFLSEITRQTSLFDRFADNNGSVHTQLHSLEVKSNKQFDYTKLQSNGKNGGGLRVKSLQVISDANTITTEYVYTNPHTGKISGITSYAPSNKKAKGVPYVSELPAPMVMYGHVKLINKDVNGNILGSTAYEFETLESSFQELGYIFSLGDAFKVRRDQHQTIRHGVYNDGTTGEVLADKYTFYDHLGNLGRLLSVSSYNNLDNKLHEKVYQYKTNLDEEMGVTQESFKSLKKVNVETLAGGLFDETFFVSSTSKVSYPSVLESTITTQGGFTSSTSYDKYDFLTGQVLETTTTNSKGEEIKTEVVPAYTIQEYNNNVPGEPGYLTGYGMGSKVDDATNKNMLAQQAMSTTSLKVGNDWQKIGVGISTWNNQWEYTNADGTTNSPTVVNQKIWRKHKSFVWDGDVDSDGLYIGFNGEEDNFNWSVGSDIAQTNSNWKNMSTTTKYDHYSMPVEIKDINGNYASTKMGDKDSKIFATSNAGYNEMFYSGAEDLDGNNFGGHIGLGTATVENDTLNVHTGNHSLRIASGQEGYVVSVTEGTRDKYKISLWAKYGFHTNLQVKIGNNAGIAYNADEVARAGEWMQLNFYFTISDTQTVSIINSGGAAYVDDFRLHPVTSGMTSYVYNEWDELTYIHGSNNMAIKYEYDTAGRLYRTFTEVEDFNGDGTGGFKKTSKHEYTYKR